MIRRIIAALKERSKPTEEASRPGGLLSYAGEWHALIIGLGTGYSSAVLAQPMLLAGLCVVSLGIKGIESGVKFRGRGVTHELRREPWYAVGGGLLAYVAMGGRLAELTSLLP